MEIGTLISELRDRLGLSQEKLAAQLKVSLPTVNRWEKGRAKPDPRAVHLIQQFLQRLGPGYEDLYQRYFS
ncbi:MAG TPA: helix-turn-helix domain-containing protein, partial [Candidatus Binatia bacterium]|nr:helix-turn-helix domain-containing protein [Candidatus Binatia bacterium]